MDRSRIFSSLVSNTLNECPCWRCLSWSERSSRSWPSLELRLLFFVLFALVVLPRLLPLLASHAFILGQIVLSPSTWCRFPRIPHHSVQEWGVPRSSFHSASQCMVSNHATRCSDQASVLLSRPSQTPSSHADSSVLTTAPGCLHATASPTSKIGFW